MFSLKMMMCSVTLLVNDGKFVARINLNITPVWRFSDQRKERS